MQLEQLPRMGRGRGGPEHGTSARRPARAADDELETSCRRSARTAPGAHPYAEVGSREEGEDHHTSPRPYFAQLDGEARGASARSIGRAKRLPEPVRPRTRREALARELPPRQIGRPRGRKEARLGREQLERLFDRFAAPQPLEQPVADLPAFEATEEQRLALRHGLRVVPEIQVEAALQEEAGGMLEEAQELVDVDDRGGIVTGWQGAVEKGRQARSRLAGAPRAETVAAREAESEGLRRA